MSEKARVWLDRIGELDIADDVRLMNVCGGHERSISMAGLRSLLPRNIRLIPGPGCPVCICPEEDIHQAIQWALHEPVTLASFGDMLRVPVNVAKGEARSLEEAKAAGADVRAIASPLDVLGIANENPGRSVIFHAVGFETTLAPTAALIAQGLPRNVFVLMSGRLTWPAVKMLLESPDQGLDALIAPGHVSTVMGPEEWEFVPRDHHIPAAIAGFTAESLLQATYSVLHQRKNGEPRLDNCYAAVVRQGGNGEARRLIATCFDIVDAPWRGIGAIPKSGYALKPSLAARDARLHFPNADASGRRRVGQMPPGCDCARVVLGKISPPECRLYGAACSPRTPVGPCMVSDEGACRIWWASGIRERSGSVPA